MGETTQISWTDASFNPWWGCTAVSAGCDHCYAEAFDKRVGGKHWGKGVPRRTFGNSHWNEPLRWSRDAEKEGIRRKVFCASMADVMDDESPQGERERLWSLIDSTPWLTWQLLTKRPQRYARYLPGEGFKHRNVWLGCTTENQEFYEVRWPHLHSASKEHGLKSFISYEPAIGSLNIELSSKYNWPPNNPFWSFPDWVICGGESGSGHRPMDPLWAENMKSQCAAHGIKFYMKQMSAHNPAKGAELIPANLLLREFPA